MKSPIEELAAYQENEQAKLHFKQLAIEAHKRSQAKDEKIYQQRLDAIRSYEWLNGADKPLIGTNSNQETREILDLISRRARHLKYYFLIPSTITITILIYINPSWFLSLFVLGLIAVLISFRREKDLVDVIEKLLG
jgi:hypothetical protein